MYRENLASVVFGSGVQASKMPSPCYVGQAGNLDLVRSFFDSVIDVTMNYVIKSQGWGGGIDRNKEVCLLVSVRHVLRPPYLDLMNHQGMRILFSFFFVFTRAYVFWHGRQWGLMFRYDVRYGGYFRVRMQYKANRRCSPLRVLDKYIVLCACVAVLALIYQVSVPRHTHGCPSWSPPPPTMVPAHRHLR